MAQKNKNQKDTEDRVDNMIKLKSLLTEEEVVKNKKTGNVYVVQNFDSTKHDKPTPAEIDKAKASNNGVLPKGEPHSQTPKIPKNTAPVKTDQKISGSDLKTSAEKSNGIPKLKDLMPGADFSNKPLSKVTPVERQQISTIIDKLAELVDKIKETGNTLVLVDRINAGHALVERLDDAVFVSGGMKVNDRKEEYDEVSTATNKVIIATYGVASTGINIPRIFNPNKGSVSNECNSC